VAKLRRRILCNPRQGPNGNYSVPAGLIRLLGAGNPNREPRRMDKACKAPR
jgi:hypothetical protein